MLSRFSSRFIFVSGLPGIELNLPLETLADLCSDRHAYSSTVWQHCYVLSTLVWKCPQIVTAGSTYHRYASLVA